MAFNEEITAKAIYESKVPIISAVGHETDFTIADFVADLRAPTPTAAAELAVPHINELLERVLTRQTRMTRAMKEQISRERTKLTRIEKSYAFRYPHRLYEQKLEQLDKKTEQLVRSAQKLFSLKTSELEQIERRLQRNHPQDKLEAARERQEKTAKALFRAMSVILAKKQTEFTHKLSQLEALSPLKIMERGYSLTYGPDGNLLKSAADIGVEEKVTVKLADGALICEVVDKGE